MGIMQKCDKVYFHEDLTVELLPTRVLTDSTSGLFVPEHTNCWSVDSVHTHVCTVQYICGMTLLRECVRCCQ